MSEEKPKDPKKAKRAAVPKTYGPQRFGVKPWQSGKPHATAAQLKGKSRKVH